MDWFWLYRPAVPSVRAQSIQVVHMAHAMACRGHEVTLVADPVPGLPTREAEVLAFYGLSPHRGLHLEILPASRTLASVKFRTSFARWVARTGGSGVVYARHKRYAAEAVRIFGRRFRLVVEAHEVDSLQAMERGEDPAEFRALEREVFTHAWGVVANAPGTLQLLQEQYPDLPPSIALQNATHGSRIRRPKGYGEGIGYVGSIRPTKDLDCLAKAASFLPYPIHLVGAEPEHVGRLQQLADGKLVVEPPIAHHAVPDRLAQFRALVLPLGKGLFGEQLSSPLKLWDYLASGVPFVAADLPSLHAAAPGMFLPYRSGDADALADALFRVAGDEALRRQLRAAMRVRTWDTRASEVESFVRGLG
jgi:glycosyltransferase involved in cell wall biosynthesis